MSAQILKSSDGLVALISLPPSPRFRSQEAFPMTRDEGSRLIGLLNTWLSNELSNSSLGSHLLREPER